MSAQDAAFMAQALRLAERGRYTTMPNPCVGAVIVKDGQVVGRGYHVKAGEGHAEVHALREAGEAARGATVYCTLEPCSFHGRTPSCAQALVAAGVARVVVAMTDPHTRNRGAGLGILRAAGIEVLCPLLESSALALNPGHARRYETGLPYVRVKLAMSLDGKTALATGESKWITGAEARRDVQRLRARSGAIVTGVQTIVDDDPALNVRADELDVEHNEISASLLRPVVVLDSALRIPAGARVLENPATIVACLEQTGNPGFEEERILRLPAGADGRVDPGALLRELAGRDVNEVLFECGATLAASVIRGGYVDEIVIYAAPVMLGADARSLLNIAKIDTMRDRIEFQINEVRRVGKDMRITCIPQRH